MGTACWAGGGRRGEELEGDHARGAVSALNPLPARTRRKVVLSGIETYGDTIHVFVERKAYNGVFLPGYQPGIRPSSARRRPQVHRPHGRQRRLGR